MTTMQCFQQKCQRWTHCVKYGNFIQFSKAEMFRKRTGNGVSTENVLTKRLSKNSIFYSTFYEQADESNLQKYKAKKRNYETQSK